MNPTQDTTCAAIRAAANATLAAEKKARHEARVWDSDRAIRKVFGKHAAAVIATRNEDLSYTVCGHTCRCRYDTYGDMAVVGDLPNGHGYYLNVLSDVAVWLESWDGYDMDMIPPPPVFPPVTLQDEGDTGFLKWLKGLFR